MGAMQQKVCCNAPMNEMQTLCRIYFNSHIYDHPTPVINAVKFVSMLHLISIWYIKYRYLLSLSLSLSDAEQYLFYKLNLNLPLQIQQQLILKPNKTFFFSTQHIGWFREREGGRERKS